jgi:hypothetical protein
LKQNVLKKLPEGTTTAYGLEQAEYRDLIFECPYSMDASLFIGLATGWTTGIRFAGKTENFIYTKCPNWLSESESKSKSHCD